MGIILVAGLIFFTLAMVVMGIIQTQSQKEVEARVSDINQEVSGGASVLVGRQKDLSDSFTVRVVFPLAQNISDKIQALIPLSGKSWIRQKLVQAGYRKDSYVKIFIGIHALTTLIPTGLVLLMIFVTHSVSGVVAFVLLVFLGGLGFGLPVLWLWQQASKRQDSIQKSLPDFIDLLIICIEAGLGMDMAISKIIKVDLPDASDFLRQELIRYTKDVGFGMNRRDALLDLADRTGVDDLNTVINAIVQSFEMGTSVANTLRVQSDALRQRRLHRAEEKANKISVKMVLPIYLFFFPGIFIVILGPMVMYAFTNIMSAVHTNSGAF